MTAARVFVVYHFVDIAHRDYRFAMRLINDLRTSGIDVLAEETAIQNGNFVQFLNEILPTCQWLILVQTPEALRSPQVQMAVNTALTLVVQQRMRGVLPVIAVACEPQEVPATWATLKTYDATLDYQRTLAKVLLTLGLDPVLSGKRSAIAPPPSRASLSISTIDRPLGHPPSPTRQHRKRWLTAISVALSLVLLITSVVLATKTFSKSSPNPGATTTAAAIAGLNARETANANATVDANLTATAIAQANATTTASASATARANASATAIAQANASATANANASATAIALADPYPPFSGKLALSDPLNNNGRGYGWEEAPLNSGSGSCQFIQNAYTASAPQNVYKPCHSTVLQPGNFTFEVRMQIIAGDCGGISLRDTTTKAYSYYFMVCENGTYGFFRFDGFTASVLTLRSGSSTAIITGLKQPNLIAIVANGSNFDLYVNHQRIDSVSDSTYSQGEFGVSADANTTAAYTFARMWTL